MYQRPVGAKINLTRLTNLQLI